MNYTKEVAENLDLVNEVLYEIQVPYLLENPDFSLDEMSMESWLKVNLSNVKHNRIPLSITFTTTGLEIRLDRIAEAIDWSVRDLKESSSVVSTMLKNLFTSYILVEYYGLSLTLISLFRYDGKCTNNFKYSEGLSLKKKREARLYNPIYPRRIE